MFLLGVKIFCGLGIRQMVNRLLPKTVRIRENRAHQGILNGKVQLSDGVY